MLPPTITMYLDGEIELEDFMNITDFVEFIKERRSGQFKTNNDVAQYLGTRAAQLSNWRTRKRDLTNREIAGLFERSRKAAVEEAQSTAIKPIVEFYPVERVLSRQAANWELFASDDEAPLPARGLRNALDNARGVYVFYDTRGRALYVGMTEKLTLWKEMNKAFNRDRSRQELFRVGHPTKNQEFVTASEKARQIKQVAVVLADLTAYFSAYEVTQGMINVIEALLIRAFANDLLNKKMENF